MTRRIKRGKTNLPEKPDHITFNNYSGIGHYAGNSECSNQTNLKGNAEESRNKKQGKYGNKTPDRGGEKKIGNVEDPSCSLMMGITTNEWYDIPST